MAAVRGVFTLNRVRLKKFVNEWTDLAQVWIDLGIPDTGYFAPTSVSTPGGNIAAASKLTYSTETIAAIFSIQFLKKYLAATGNSTAGYFGGGADPSSSPSSQMNKVTYSSDTKTAVPGANLTSNTRRLAATGTLTAGYFGGGRLISRTTVDKVTYSNDTTAAVPSASLSASRHSLAATGNSTAGYFGGGAGPVSTMEKVTYSNDTRTIVPTANLSNSRTELAATGNSTAGYFGGGTPGRTDKVTYSTDTTTYTPSANINDNALAATGNSTNGYFGGGVDITVPISSMSKITYSTDTVVTSVNLVGPESFLAASSAKANALPQNLWRRFSDGTTTTNPASLPPATPTPQTYGGNPVIV